MHNKACKIFTSPYTLHFTPYTPRPSPYTIHPTPLTPKPYITSCIATRDLIPERMDAEA